MKGDATDAFSIGQAAHITAKSKGGPRFNPSLTSEERRSANNGIWLCGNCHPEVDADDSHFTVEQLNQHKENAERDQDEIYRSRPVSDDAFVVYSEAEPLGVASYVQTATDMILSARIINPEFDGVTYYTGSAYVVRCLVRKQDSLNDVAISSVHCRVDSVSGVPEFRPLYGAYPTEVSLLFVEIDKPELAGRNTFLCESQFVVSGKLEHSRIPFSPIVLDSSEWYTIDVRVNARHEGLYTLTLEMVTLHEGNKRTEVLRLRDTVLFLGDYPARPWSPDSP